MSKRSTKKAAVKKAGEGAGEVKARVMTAEQKKRLSSMKREIEGKSAAKHGLCAHWHVDVEAGVVFLNVPTAMGQILLEGDKWVFECNLHDGERGEPQTCAVEMMHGIEADALELAQQTAFALTDGKKPGQAKAVHAHAH